jgi:hypothetical protein
MLGIRSLGLLILTSMILIVAGGTFFRTLINSRDLPLCWNCGASKVRRSARKGFMDAFAVLFLLVPYRCRACRVRFYGIRTHAPLV